MEEKQIQAGKYYLANNGVIVRVNYVLEGVVNYDSFRAPRGVVSQITAALENFLCWVQKEVAVEDLSGAAREALDAGPVKAIDAREAQIKLLRHVLKRCADALAEIEWPAYETEMSQAWRAAEEVLKLVDEDIPKGWMPPDKIQQARKYLDEVLQWACVEMCPSKKGKRVHCKECIEGSAILALFPTLEDTP